MRTKILILLSLFSFVWSMPWVNRIQTMGTQLMLNKEPRIIGGEQASLHAFPYQAALYFDNKTIFGGCLITNRWVVTTAAVANWTGGTKPLVILGAQYLNNNEFSQQRIQSDEIIFNELWGSSKGSENNIALLHLDRAALLNRFVNTVMLAPFNAPDHDGSLLMMSGFGYISPGNPSWILRYVIVEGISNSDCKTIRGDSINDGTLCTETTGGKGGCTYDAGNPLVDVDNGLLIGLTHSYQCAGLGVPDVFTRVSYFNKWIADKIN